MTNKTTPYDPADHLLPEDQEGLIEEALATGDEDVIAGASKIVDRARAHRADSDLEDKLPIEMLKDRLSQAKALIPVYVPYEHYRGGRYLVIGHTVDKNSNIIRVVYVREEDRGLPDQVPFDCPMMEWDEPVEVKTEGPENEIRPRFRMVEVKNGD